MHRAPGRTADKFPSNSTIVLLVGADVKDSKLSARLLQQVPDSLPQDPLRRRLLHAKILLEK